MRAGELDRRVSLRRYTVKKDAFNADVPSWPEFACVRAAKTDVSDGERLRAAEQGASVTTRFKIRWSRLAATLTARDRLECEGRAYDVVGVKEIGRREGLEITANRRGDA